MLTILKLSRSDALHLRLRLRLNIKRGCQGTNATCKYLERNVNSCQISALICFNFLKVNIILVFLWFIYSKIFSVRALGIRGQRVGMMACSSFSLQIAVHLKELHHFCFVKDQSRCIHWMIFANRIRQRCLS